MTADDPSPDPRRGPDPSPDPSPDPRHDPSDESSIPRGGSLLGTLLILAGLLVFLQQVRFLEKTGIDLTDLWPLFLVVVGVRAVRHTEGVARFIGFLFTLVGLGLLALNLGYTDSAWTAISTWFTEHDVDPAVLIPVGLVLTGLFFLLGGPRVFLSKVELNEGDRLGQLAIFGGQVISPQLEDFRGGWLSATFGGFEVDLRDCASKQEVIKLDVVAIFGGGEIKVPTGWKVQMTGLPIFGGFSSSAKFDPEGRGGHPVLKVNGFAMFGGYEITN